MLSRMSLYVDRLPDRAPFPAQAGRVWKPDPTHTYPIGRVISERFEGDATRMHDHVVDGNKNLPPRITRNEPDDYIMHRVAVRRTAVLDTAALLSLQRAAGNKAITALVQRCGSTPCACSPDEEQAAESRSSITAGTPIQRREMREADEVEERGGNPRVSTPGEARADRTHDRGRSTSQSTTTQQRLAGNAALTATLDGPVRHRPLVVQTDKEPDVAKKTGPCKDPSLANTFKPSDTWGGKAWDATLGAQDFGNTSKLAARFDFGACKDKDGWHFYLKTLEVMITSKIQPPDFRVNVTDASNSAVTKDEVPKIISDLNPDRSVTFSISCGADKFEDKVTTYSRRRKYWNVDFVATHEAFHRTEWEAIYRTQLVKAEEKVRGHMISLKDAATEVAALTKARKDLEEFMIDAFREACKAYSPTQESHAYDHGAPQYQKLVDEIMGRAVKEKWITK